MDITAIGTVWSTDPAPQPATAAPPGEDLAKASREFEALLLRQFLGQALKPILHESPGSEAPGGHIYQHMMTDAIASEMAGQEIFGMASLLQMQLAGPPPSAPAPDQSPRS